MKDGNISIERLSPAQQASGYTLRNTQNATKNIRKDKTFAIRPKHR